MQEQVTTPTTCENSGQHDRLSPQYQQHKHRHRSRHIRSFAPRARRLTPQRQRAFDELQQQYILEIKAGATGLTTCLNTFPVAQPITLEIGFGMGEMLWHLVQNHPDCNFIGIEVHRPGIANFLAKLKTAATLQQRPYNNVRLFNDDAVVVLKKCIPEQSLKKIMLFFPDPWPKKRHHKRRLVQPSFTALIAAKLEPAGTFHMITDCQSYAEHSQSVLAATPNLQEQQVKCIWGPEQAKAETPSSLAQAEFRPAAQTNSPPLAQILAQTTALPLITKFAQRALDQGSKIWELVFSKDG